MHKLNLFLIAMALAATVHSEDRLLAPANYELCYDINMSPYAGGEDLLFSTRLIEAGTTYIAEKTGSPTSKSLLAKSVRLGELVAFYLPLNFFTTIVQHEVFGHGYRIRDINHGKISVSGYRFDFPPPYGSGNAETSFTFNPSKITTNDLTCLSMAGIEAQFILAFETKFKWLEARRIDPRQSALYIVSQFVLNLYASAEGLEEYELDGHDLHSYVESLNYTYTANRLTTSHIQALSWINLIDPFAYYSIYSWFRYIASGKETKIPMIPMFGYGYLFGARLGLTPFGPEYYFENYLLKGNKPIYFYLKGGNHAKNTYLGLGFFAPRIWTLNQWSLGARFDSWRQPKLLLQQGKVPLTELDFREQPNSNNPLYTPFQQHQTHYGCAASLIGSYRLNRAFGFQAELGVKTSGFLPGYSLYPSPVLRISYLATF